MVAPHFHCIGCNRLFVLEGDYLLPCVNEHHLKNVKPVFQIA